MNKLEKIRQELNIFLNKDIENTYHFNSLKESTDAYLIKTVIDTLIRNKKRDGFLKEQKELKEDIKIFENEMLTKIHYFDYFTPNDEKKLNEIISISELSLKDLNFVTNLNLNLENREKELNKNKKMTTR